ncbi:ABC transporter permease [Labrenzia sp. PHM005]|uniref:ABC transporter permease n=1 Tax=Labrenzia sp. PHM005 TaxID=2590016 RepID=UPI0011401789|nr:ABC transporter permease [Labrenzia sp. PHM005]QDG76193.1 ABC transporter permease [Labrenzia sp. PHM005]
MNQKTKKIRPEQVQYIGLILVTLAIAIGFQMVFGNVLTGANLRVLAMNMVFEGIMAIGMTFVIIMGGIDLSVASVFAFAEILVAKLMVEAGLPVFLAVSLTVLASMLIGAINGTLIVLLRVHPLIITLGMLLTLRGVNLAITDGKSISGFSDSFLYLGQGQILGIDVPIWFFAIAALVLGLLLAHHRYFRQLYFIGGSERSARFSGVNTDRVKISIYVLCSTLAGCAGIMAAARYGAAHWGHGNLAELKAIAAVAVGGADIMGGSGTMFGTVLGVIFLAVVHNVFVTSAINPFWYDVVNGAMLLLAVLLSRMIALKNRRDLLSARQMKLDQTPKKLIVEES